MFQTTNQHLQSVFDRRVGSGHMARGHIPRQPVPLEAGQTTAATAAATSWGSGTSWPTVVQRLRFKSEGV